MRKTKSSGGRKRDSSIPDLELRLCITVVEPPADVLFCVQGRLAEYLDAKRSKGGDLVFDAVVRVAAEPKASTPRLLGPVTQGPPSKRFLYICSGTSAGDPSSCWTRRAKVPLTGITDKLIARVRNGGRLEARIHGRAKDGGPACATVPLLDGGWRAVK